MEREFSSSAAPPFVRSPRASSVSGCSTVYQVVDFLYEVGPVHHGGRAKTVSVEFAGIFLSVGHLLRTIEPSFPAISRYFPRLPAVAVAGVGSVPVGGQPERIHGTDMRARGVNGENNDSLTPDPMVG